MGGCLIVYSVNLKSKIHCDNNIPYSHGFVYLMTYSFLVLLNAYQYLTFLQISNLNSLNTGCHGNIPPVIRLLKTLVARYVGRCEGLSESTVVLSM